MNPLFQTLLTDENMRLIAKDLGIENDPQEAQFELISLMGENITKRLVLALITALPETAHAEFERYLGSGDAEGLHDFLAKHIPNLNQVVIDEARKEIEETLAEADESTPGTETAAA